METKKGFTLVELIIVIAVIGVLAAILIPTFSNVIEKSNLKSANSDARNALSIYIAELTNGENGGQVLEDGAVFKVKKANKDWYFTYTENGIREGDGTEGASAKDVLELAEGQHRIISGENSEYYDEYDEENGDAIVPNLPSTVVIYTSTVPGTAATPSSTVPPELQEVIDEIVENNLIFADFSLIMVKNGAKWEAFSYMAPSTSNGVTVTPYGQNMGLSGINTSDSDATIFVNALANEDSVIYGKTANANAATLSQYGLTGTTEANLPDGVIVWEP